jgi:hypothetical protein
MSGGEGEVFIGEGGGESAIGFADDLRYALARERGRVATRRRGATNETRIDSL